MNVVASVIGGIVFFILRFFLGSIIAGAIKKVFLGYCYVVYMLCDGRPRPEKSQGNAICRLNNVDMHDKDDYELHPSYQTLVDQEPDDYARSPNWPSYLNLLRLGFLYVLLQLGSPSELLEFAKLVWESGKIELGTQRQLNFLMVLILLHIQYACLGQIVSMIERVLLYPRLSREETKDRSVLYAVPRMVRRALQESLNSTVATTVVLSTIAGLGLLVMVLSVGVAHDIQGIVAQTHQRVMTFQEAEAQAALGLLDNQDRQEGPFVRQADEALSQAYDAGLGWFDPILKDAFPVLSWGATEWAFQVANVIVDPEAPLLRRPQPSQKARKSSDSASQLKAWSALDDSGFGSLVIESPQRDASEQVQFASSSFSSEEAIEHPELWHIPTLQSLGFVSPKQINQATFMARKRSEDGDFSVKSDSQEPVEKQENGTPTSPRAINLSQIKFLTSLVLGYEGLNSENMLWGFNAFNDLLFRWILFLLGLMTFTALKVSPLQRIGWIIDQALASSPSSFGSLRLSSSAAGSTSTHGAASATSPGPGRVLAKSLEYSITGTFVSMLKLAIYHTLFTLAWTRFLQDRVMADAGLSEFVPVRYAWLTSLFGIVLIMFPIAPNWLVSIPGAVVHFYVYGQRPIEAVAMVVGHVLFAGIVDGAVWDSHVVRHTRPGVSSAFWLGLWMFLGGMKWGTKGLLLGPVLFASVPSAWSAILELRGRPSTVDKTKKWGSKNDQEREQEEERRIRRRQYGYQRERDGDDAESRSCSSRASSQSSRGSRSKSSSRPWRQGQSQDQSHIRPPIPFAVTLFPVVFYLVLIAGGYYVYVVTVCVRQIQEGSIAVGVILLLIYHLSLILMLWSYVMVIIVDPGKVSPERQHDLEVEQEDEEQESSSGANKSGASQQNEPQQKAASPQTQPQNPLPIPEPAHTRDQPQAAVPRLQSQSQVTLAQTTRSQVSVGSGSAGMLIPGAQARNRSGYIHINEDPALQSHPLWCSKCQHVKPERAHHCRVCKRCVLKMDHHCPWILNCVGQENYKFFFLFVFYTALHCILMVVTIAPLYGKTADNSIGHQLQVAAMAVGGIFGFTLVVFTVTHMRLILLNRTTIEDHDTPRNEGMLPCFRKGWVQSEGEINQGNERLYDVGYKENWEQALGPGWSCMIPTRLPRRNLGKAEEGGIVELKYNQKVVARQWRDYHQQMEIRRQEQQQPPAQLESFLPQTQPGGAQQKLYGVDDLPVGTTSAVNVSGPAAATAAANPFDDR
ncbi:hypothetical protein BGW38_003687 [Lunasporangiospora selenospora]|uniref:Palmitoyltransferase DHHC domain-containing protein n=1 Tax=Lunasporangiospora selenospora TaxID=979761 RepID=A0A9P6G2N8_9FUNG|nr:hypothetical protein BGW38_003687 [Lunasporangiospora selenospora]